MPRARKKFKFTLTLAENLKTALIRCRSQQMQDFEILETSLQALAAKFTATLSHAKTSNMRVTGVIFNVQFLRYCSRQPELVLMVDVAAGRAVLSYYLEKTRLCSNRTPTMVHPAVAQPNYSLPKATISL